jgi:hypothetical protein
MPDYDNSRQITETLRKMNVQSIAPCGINCATCLAYLRKKNTCSGCRSDNASKRKYCTTCGIKNCIFLSVTESKLCYECTKFPCVRIKHIDKRYRTKYNLSLISNLEKIQEIGLGKFLESENEKWRCNNCGGTICVHRGFCLSCAN